MPIRTGPWCAVAALVFLAACAPEGAARFGAGALPATVPRVTGSTRIAEAEHAALLRAYGGEYRSPALKAYLDGIVEALVARTERPGDPFTVTILDGPGVNAFALPSGRLYLTRGLLALANDEAEVAAVIAHEIAHVTLHHAEKREEREARAVLVRNVEEGLLGGLPVGLRPPAALGPPASTGRGASGGAGFSRDQEFEADAVGIRTLAAAGYDPGAAARFLRTLERDARLDGRGGTDLLRTHPATAARIARAAAEARALDGAAAGTGRTDHARYVASLDGLAYGSDPADGLVKGRRFLHPRLGVRFDAPAGFVLDNTARAVVGATGDDTMRLLFDAVAGDGGDLGALLAESWSEPLAEPPRITTVNGHEAAVAAASGTDWSFRLAAIRFEQTTFRLIMASRTDRPAFAQAFEATLASVTPLAAAEAGDLRPRRLALVVAAPRESVDEMAARVAMPVDRLRVLNGLAPAEGLVPGRTYKHVAER